MNVRATIKKLFFVSLWLIIGAGIITLLAAAMRKQKQERCKDYLVRIKGGGDVHFINEPDIQTLVRELAGGELKGLPLSALNLHQLEKGLETNTWVEDAEIYLDSRAVLHIHVIEKEPVARIFTVAGNSFYIDSSLKKLPLSEKISAKVPVFTGFPERKTWLLRDSLLIREVRALAQFVLNDPFWNKQVTQIDITADRQFEMIPLVGNHLVRFGTAENMEDKFRRLFVFYKKWLSQAGFNRYPVIDVRWKGQVVATRVDDKRKVDSVQLRKNVEKMLQTVRSQTQAIDSSKNNNKKVNPSVETTLNPNPVKAQSVSGEKESADEKKKIPKAVMPVRNPGALKQQDNFP